MSDLKSVLAFFIGLVFFVLLVVFAISRIRSGAKPTTSAKNQPTITVTFTPSPTPVGMKKAQQPSLLSRIMGFFTAKKPTVIKPTVTPTPSANSAVVEQITASPNYTLKESLKPTVILYTQTKGGVKQPTVNTVAGVTTIPETGAETFVLPLAGALAGLGIYFKKRK